ncbi:MAG: 23S rRNA (uracil(1939)-C(5))-methyltransferase RlmD, partial [Negativicoccus succinicivorans]|nr:23S rRNA (uracil(1939)-C(5))-methyltransferase RlmD [Negativicoccus succinicivorans]
EGVTPDVIVMDPARAGCDEKVLATVVDWQPSRIVYVSCNPATLARDAAYLAARGYAVTYVQPVDMFPHTTHIETVALLSRRTDEVHTD